MTALWIGGMTFLTVPSMVFASNPFAAAGLETTHGFVFRLRHETWDNVFDFDDDKGLEDAVLWRMRSSLWFQNE